MRLKKIFENAPEVDAIVLTNAASPHVDMSFFYVTGLISGIFEGCSAIVYPDHIELLTSALEEESARKGGFDVSVFRTKEEGETHLRSKLKGLKKIGINADELTYGSLLKLKKNSEAEFVDVSAAINKARLTKDKEEVSRIRTACDIISRVTEEIPQMVHAGMTEQELAAEINYSMQKKGASQPAFPSLICFGKNASEPHHSSDETSLKKGDFILCDIGAQYKRYVSDITRTFIFGTAEENQKAMYAAVLRSQALALEHMKEGVEGCDVHTMVKEFLDESYPGRFIHGLGHSIGLSVHDGGRMGADSDLMLEQGMVFTVEPGVYIPGYGGVRIEDDVLITEKGVDILTTAGKELQVL
ncbi:MAG: aminopeptidase P family protein [Theionarchaea archaeon]|nr:aminopeptidase P family protein [Theionarchaea archaeon]MBU7001477.1 aminopeptidase P family protein [Theionarchaea archaeon]MBU7022215.1 aminopeptidase P family protein [Theionarchaea archaeon]MBU7040231.1 aminopeptidase P family protein [Theionarchaea archaeon]